VKLRNHPQLRDLWPPEPQSTSFGSNKSPVGELDVLEWLSFRPSSPGWPATVTMNTTYNRRNFVRDLSLDDSQFAQELAAHLRPLIGQTIGKIGDTEIEFAVRSEPAGAKARS
jgi:hypothetical protein